MSTTLVISDGDGGVGVRLAGPDPTEVEQRAAAQAAIDYGHDGFTVEEFVAASSVVHLFEHTSDESIQDAGCGCDEAGWMCPEGDGDGSFWLWVGA